MKYLAMRYGRKIDAGVLVVYFALAIILYVIYILVRAFLAYAPISNIDVWQIANTQSLRAEILWQKSAQCLGGWVDDLNGVVTASELHVVISCKSFWTDSAVAFDRLTGRRAWQERSNNPNFVAAVDDGYLILFEGASVKKVNFDGDIRWRYNFQSRSVHAVYPYGASIFVPYYDFGIRFVQSPETGLRQYEIEVDGVVAAFDDYLVTAQGDDLAVLDSQTYQTMWLEPITEQLEYRQVDRSGRVLLVHFRRGSIQAYDIASGAHLWMLPHAFGTQPFVLDDWIVIYDWETNTVSIHDVFTGVSLGAFTLMRSGSSPDLYGSEIALGGSGDVLVVGYRGSGSGLGEVIAVQFALAED